MLQVNQLYPIFLKADNLEFLIVGGGYVALEKMEFLFKSSPNARVTLVAPFLRSETKEFIQEKNVRVILRKFRLWDLRKKNIVIATTDVPLVNKKVQKACNRRGILVNVADTPDLCDFYMGGNSNERKFKDWDFNQWKISNLSQKNTAIFRRIVA